MFNQSITMINIMSYVGMNLQAEVCMWTLMGLILTIFDATLFKVNANLKQVWLMQMPPELALSIQHGIRIVISGTMLVQCFSVYAYLASYIVLLYPVILEERHILVLPWLLLAAIKQLLCELTNLALGLGICVLLGASRPSCIKFLISKMASILPSWYMWMLVLSYYRSLKMVATFKTFPAVLPAINNNDIGLELAIRRRRTKSLFNEDMLRQKLVHYYQAKPFDIPNSSISNFGPIQTLSNIKEDEYQETFLPLKEGSKETSEFINLQDLPGIETTIPRDTDRILEQFVIMLLKVSIYLRNERESLISLDQNPMVPEEQGNYLNNAFAVPSIHQVSSSNGVKPSYLNDFPKIFQRKQSEVSQINNASAALSVPQESNTSGVKSSYINDFPQIFQRKQSEVPQISSSERIIPQNHDTRQDQNVSRTSNKVVTFFQSNQTKFQVEKSVSVKTYDNKGNMISSEEKNVAEEVGDLKEYVNKIINPKSEEEQTCIQDKDINEDNNDCDDNQSIAKEINTNLDVACSTRTLDLLSLSRQTSESSISRRIDNANNNEESDKKV